jgi:flagellar hook-associated protein 2
MNTLMPDIINPGMDVRQIVDELMKLQREPINRIIQKKNDYHLQQTGYNNLESLLSKFNSSLDKLSALFKTNSYSVTSSDESIVSVAATGALLSAGEHTINVTQYAKADQVASTTFTSRDTALAMTGSLSFTIGANSFNLSIAETDTLESIKDAINNAADNVGVTASILSTNALDGSPEYSLVLSSNNTGLENAISFGGDLLPSFEFTKYISEAKDAILTFDTYSVTRSSNTISDLLEGLELNLNGTIGSTTISVSANMNNKINTIASGIQAVVDTYNDVIHGIDYVQSKKGLTEHMYSWVRTSLSNAMRQTIGTGDITSLLDIGISTGDSQERANDEGVNYVTSNLTVDSAELIQQLTNNYQAVKQLFTANDTGFIASIDDVIEKLQSSTGPIETRKTTAKNNEELFEKRVENEETRLEGVRKKLLIQYSKLNTVVQHYEQLAKYLESQMKALNDVKN